VASTGLALLGTLGLVALGLAACSPPPPPPEPPTAEEIAAVRAEMAQSWWDSMDLDVPMPHVEVIEELPAQQAAARQTQCLEEANLPGVQVDGPGTWSFGGSNSDDVGFVDVQTLWWVCAQQYPSTDETEFLLSASELAWLYDFYVQRYEPCVATLGIELLDLPPREYFLSETGGYPAWVPYEQSLRPVPTADDWQVLAQRCPLPDMLAAYGLPGYPAER
jgi:hypothetical protein